MAFPVGVTDGAGWKHDGDHVRAAYLALRRSFAAVCDDYCESLTPGKGFCGDDSGKDNVVEPIALNIGLCCCFVVLIVCILVNFLWCKYFYYLATSLK